MTPFPNKVEMSVPRGAGVPAGVVFSSLMAVLHLRHAGSFGVAFPDMSAADRTNALRPRNPWLGDVMVVSGTREALDAVLSDPDVVGSVSAGYLDPSRIGRNAAWPDVRVRPVTDGSAARRARRHERRAAEAGRPQASGARQRQPRPLLVAEGEDRAFRAERQENLPHLVVTSLSNGRRFTLSVARRPDGDEDWVLGSYGLLVRPVRSAEAA